MFWTQSRQFSAANKSKLLDQLKQNLVNAADLEKSIMLYIFYAFWLP